MDSITGAAHAVAYRPAPPAARLQADSSSRRAATAGDDAARRSDSPPRHNATRGQCKLAILLANRSFESQPVGLSGMALGRTGRTGSLCRSISRSNILCCVAVYSAASGLLVLVVFSGEVSVAASAVSCDRRLDFKGSGYPARALLTAQAAPQRFVRRKVRQCAAV